MHFCAAKLRKIAILQFAQKLQNLQILQKLQNCNCKIAKQFAKIANFCKICKICRNCKLQFAKMQIFAKAKNLQNFAKICKKAKRPLPEGLFAKRPKRPYGKGLFDPKKAFASLGFWPKAKKSKTPDWQRFFAEGKNAFKNLCQSGVFGRRPKKPTDKGLLPKAKGVPQKPLPVGQKKDPPKKADWQRPFGPKGQKEGDPSLHPYFWQICQKWQKCQKWSKWPFWPKWPKRSKKDTTKCQNLTPFLAEGQKGQKMALLTIWPKVKNDQNRSNLTFSGQKTKFFDQKIKNDQNDHFWPFWSKRSRSKNDLLLPPKK